MGTGSTATENKSLTGRDDVIPVEKGEERELRGAGMRAGFLGLENGGPGERGAE